MRSRLPILLTLVVLLFHSGEGWGANFQKGLEAYNKNDDATALREWEPLAKQGNADAQFNLGQMYYYGHGVYQDDKTAVKWYRRAADQGHNGAQFSMGWMYDAGLGVAHNYEAAAKWYGLAVAQGHGHAKMNLQNLLEKKPSEQMLPSTEGNSKSTERGRNDQKENIEEHKQKNPLAATPEEFETLTYIEKHEHFGPKAKSKWIQSGVIHYNENKKNMYPFR